MLTNNFQKILFNRRHAIAIPEYQTVNKENDPYIATLETNLHSINYGLSLDMVYALRSLPTEEIAVVCAMIEDIAKESVGDDKQYNPMYPGFPRQVMEMNEAELYLNAIFHYLTAGEYMPYPEVDDGQIDNVARSFQSNKIIDLGKESDLFDIARNLMLSQTAFSPQDKKDLTLIRDSMDAAEFTKCIPDRIPNKENLAWAFLNLSRNDSIQENEFIGKIKTPTDMLRVLAAHSDGDVTLTNKVRFHNNLSRSDCRFIAQFISQMAINGHQESDVYNRREQFKALARHYHFRNNKNPIVSQFMDKLFGNTLERSFASKRDQAIADMEKGEGSFEDVLKLYKQNPGMIGVDMMRLAAMAKQDAPSILALDKYFKEYAPRMSVTNLLRVAAVAEDRTQEKDFSVFAPGKGLKNPYVVAEPRKTIDPLMCSLIKETVSAELASRFEQKRPLGEVYIDPELKNITIPQQQRNSGTGARNMSYGSKLPVDEKINNLRTFIWWTNTDKQRVDVDLSAHVYDKDYNTLGTVAYYSNYDLKNALVHSGDIVDGGKPGGKGAAEFIDVDLKTLQKNIPDAKYISFTVNSFAGGTFNDLTCRFGWMESDRTSAKNFDASLVKMSYDVNALSYHSVPIVYDIDERRMIWIDRSPSAEHNIKFNDRITNDVSYATPTTVEVMRVTNASLPNVYDLAHIHASARGHFTDDPQKADTIFMATPVSPVEFPNATEIYTPEQTDVLFGEYMNDQLTEKDREYFKEQEEIKEREEEGELVRE